ncbi:MAG: lipid-A-disaccharide synthase [Caulobacteraceae bacterium]
MSAPLKVMLVAVEPSADALGAGLARALKETLGEDAVAFVGVGGAKMAAEGVGSPIDIADLSLVGIFEIAGAVPLALRAIETTTRLAESERPDVAVLIDSWEFTWRVARRLRLRAPGVAIVKYVAPQVWASRPGRARDLARLCDGLMTLFAFEPPHFEAAGVPTRYVGNPALSRAASGEDAARFRRSIGAAPHEPILLVAPGSRRSEIRRVMPSFEDAALRLKGERPDLHLVIPAAETVAAEVRTRVSGWPHRAHVTETEADKFAAMRAATAAIACSGTVTTQLAVAGCPMVVGYRAHPATAVVARMVVRTRYLTLINIAAGEAVAPEFLQERCTGARLAEAAAILLDDPARRSLQAAAQTEALGRLGGAVPDPYAAAAEAVLETARRRGWPG